MNRKKSSASNGVSQSRLSLRKRSIILFAISVAVLIALFCTMILRTVAYKIRTFYESAADYSLNASAEIIQDRIKSYSEDLGALSKLESVQSGNRDRILADLKKLHQLKKQFVLDLFYADADGNSFSPAGIQQSISESESFKAHKEGGEDLHISRTFMSKNFHVPIFVISKSVTDKDGSLLGIILYALDSNLITNPISALPFMQESSGFLTDDEGNFILEPKIDTIITYSSDKLDESGRDSVYRLNSEIRKRQSGSVRMNSSLLGEEYVTFARIKGTVWTAGIVEQQRTVFNFLSDLYTKVILFFAVFHIILVFVFALITLSGTRGKSSHRLTLQQQDDYDELTGLWTEAHFEEKCGELLKSNPDKNYIIMGIDIRGFRIVQQTEGISAANEQLIQLSKRLGAIAMEKNGIAARGAIDHLYLMYEISGRESALKEFNSMLYNGNYLPGRAGERIPTKTGIVFAGRDFEQDSIQNLIGKTSYAKHIIQDNLLQNYSVYDKSMEANIIKDKKIERYIPIAFAHNEFYVVYQPKVDLRSGRVIGAEALVRWNSPELGPCMPDEFITLFERNGYINRLDFYVYKKVFEFLHERIQQKKSVVPISVNMSRFHLSDEKFVQKFWDLFSSYKIPPELIEVEIIERSVGNGDDRLLQVTQELHEKKFRVAIDDFGNGESSLNIISEIPADVLKLDQKFMRSDKSGREPSTDEYKIVAKIVEIAKSLGKETICEGVETEQQINFLRSVDVNYVQGFFYSKPLKEEDFVNYLEQHV